jgi:hypothetical protein
MTALLSEIWRAIEKVKNKVDITSSTAMKASHA